MSAPELKPCPFCGATSVIDGTTWRASDGKEIAWVSCTACGAYGPTDTVPKAIAKWNARYANDMETCANCMGSGYGGHPDSGAVCFDCNGTGGVALPALIAEAVAREREECAKLVLNGSGTLRTLAAAIRSRGQG
jgi:Lar family restriction alleviation protein